MYRIILFILVSFFINQSLGWGLNGETDSSEVAIAKNILKDFELLLPTQKNLNPEEFLRPAILLFQKHQIWKQYIHCNNLISHYYDQIRNHQKRVKYLNQSIQIITRFNLTNAKEIGNCFRQKGETLIAFGKLDSAKIYLKKSYTIALTNLNWEELATINVLNSVIAYYNQDYQLMERELNLALKVSEENLSPSKKIFPLIYQLFSVLYNTNGDYENAIAIAKKSIATLLRSSLLNIADSINLCDKFTNIGALYFNKGDHTQAILYYEKALSIASNASQNKINISKGQLLLKNAPNYTFNSTEDKQVIANTSAVLII